MTTKIETVEDSFRNNTQEANYLFQLARQFANQASYREQLHYNETVPHDRYARLLKISSIAGKIHDFLCEKANEIAAIDEADFNAENQ